MLCKACFSPSLCVFHPIWGGGGGLPRGLGHNLLMQLSSLGSSRMVVPLPSSRCLAEGSRIWERTGTACLVAFPEGLLLVVGVLRWCTLIWCRYAAMAVNVVCIALTWMEASLGFCLGCWSWNKFIVPMFRKEKCTSCEIPSAKPVAVARVKEIREITAQYPLVVFSKTSCPHCQQVKSVLKRLGADPKVCAPFVARTRVNAFRQCLCLCLCHSLYPCHFRFYVCLCTSLTLSEHQQPTASTATATAPRCFRCVEAAAAGSTICRRNAPPRAQSGPDCVPLGWKQPRPVNGGGGGWTTWLKSHSECTESICSPHLLLSPAQNRLIGHQDPPSAPSWPWRPSAFERNRSKTTGDVVVDASKPPFRRLVFAAFAETVCRTAQFLIFADTFLIRRFPGSLKQTKGWLQRIGLRRGWHCLQGCVGCVWEVVVPLWSSGILCFLLIRLFCGT